MIHRRPQLITCSLCGSQRNSTEPRCLNGNCPNHYPVRCYLCHDTISSAQDLDYHGKGNCVPITENFECQGCGRWTGGPVLCESCIDKHEKNGNFVITCENAGKCFFALIALIALGSVGFVVWAIVRHGTR